MNKKNKNYLYSILGVPKQLLGKHLGKEEQYKCQSYYDDENVLRDCTCGKCEKPKSSAKIGKGWKEIFKIKISKQK